MNVIFLLIGISIVVASGFLAAFIWSVKSDQFEDTYTPSLRILFEDDLTGNSKLSDNSDSRPVESDRAS